MRPFTGSISAIVLAIAVLAPSHGRAQTAAPAATRRAAEFTITYAREFQPGPINARVYVMLGPERSSINAREPRFGPDWFRPRPFFAVDAHDWKPGEPLKIGKDAVGFPGRLDTLEPGTYSAQAVVRLNPDTHRLGDGAGNAYGPIASVTIREDNETPFPLTVTTIVPPRVFPESDRIKLVEIPSPLLSEFHHRPIMHRAAVILPEGDPALKRPALYIIPGFGGDHFAAPGMARSTRAGFGKDLIRVVLDPDCGTGHHVFADSATNGPRGQALIDELIPHIEKVYNAIPEPRARLLNGHSSGGWSSLWLQVSYPDTFGGVWSTSPDPVDFRDFQAIDLYSEHENMFRDRDGGRRPIARMGLRPVLWYDAFSRMEEVIGDGGQLGSFEAVFSPLDAHGRPRRLWDRATGAVDPEVARAWEKYDIRLVLERNWERLRPRLAGKIHVVMGDRDTFYLEGAVKLLKKSLETLGSDAVVELIPERDHSTVIDAALAARFDREMNAASGVAPKGP